jgi:hypothetical protein
VFRTDVLEPHRFAEDLVFGEFVGMDVPHDGEMIACRLEVLAEGKKVGALSREILQGGENFVFFFAETQHKACLGGHFGMRFF